MYKVREAQTQEELNAIIELRYTILREPWNQPLSSASDNLESLSVNAFIKDAAGNVIACGRLQENENKTGQIRYMAVVASYQGKGLGQLIVSFLEQKAWDLGLIKVELHARENAVEFYKSRGYQMKEKSYLLWGLIQHYLMEKELK